MKIKLTVPVTAVVLLVTALAFSDSPPSNTIPIVAVRPNPDEIDLDLMCMLSWNYFDVLQTGGKSAEYYHNNLLDDANATGMYLILAPAEMKQYVGWPWGWIGRMTLEDLSSDSAYAHPAWWGVKIDGVEYTSDTLLQTYAAPDVEDTLQNLADTLDYYFGDQDLVWFYNTFDESPSWQWRHMTEDTIITDTNDTIPVIYDNYIPGVFTQNREWVADDSLPTLNEVHPEGLYSWMKHEIEEVDSTKTIVSVFGLMHDIDWCNYNYFLGTFHNQANSVRAYISAKYQGYVSPTVIPPLQNNYASLFIFNIYPTRQVGVGWLGDHTTYVNCVDGSKDTLLLAHFEEGMDSTFVPAREMADSLSLEIPVMYYPQAIGKCGGEQMWDSTSSSPSDTLLAYPSYAYRVPTPAEFLLNCNLALLRGAVGLFPYCMMSYSATDAEGNSVITAGYFDENNVRFDAPYEEWVYTDRLRSDYDVIPPDSFPPFSDSCRVCGDFDPLWDLPARPDTISGSQKTTEEYLEWKFEAYGRLWNSMQNTFGQIATVAPELTQLEWWEGYEDSIFISISYGSAGEVAPHIKLFNDGDDNGYAYYVNRNSSANRVAVEIDLDADDLPREMAGFSRLLDHNRRYFITLETDGDGEFWSFKDTLAAGQGRLVQFVGTILPADIRITRPDIRASGGTRLNTREFSFPAETEITVNAIFYNMGISSASNVVVHLTDLTEVTVLDSDTISFSGLPTSGYQCDRDTVSFTWQTDSDDIGLHLLRVNADPIAGEQDTSDNSTQVLFRITPRDYAETVLGDPWDMSEASSSPPAWHTDDVTSLYGYSSSYTDSITGMFEATISNPTLTNKLELNLGSDSTDYIATRLYDQFSMIAKAETELTVTVWWDVGGRTRYLELDEPIGTTWGEIGPFDLTADSSGWADDDVEKLWLEFESTSSSSPADVRIGWIKLTE